MKTSTWTPAIAVEDPETHILRTVKTVRQAQDALHKHWPAREGSRYRAAEAACADALRHGAKGADARKAFIAAAIEAHLHIG